MLVRLKYFLHSSDIRLYWLKGLWSESRVSWDQRQNSLFCMSLPSPSIASGIVYCPLYGCNQTLASELSSVQFCVCSLWIQISYFHFIIQWQWSRAWNAMSAYAFLGASVNTTQRRDSVRWCRGEACIYIKQITKKKKVCTLNFTNLKIIIRTVHALVLVTCAYY
jgi:hypothetical protein